MRVAVVGSRELIVEDLGSFLPEGTTEIVTGGARGVDQCAMDYAKSHGLKLKVFWPDYETHGKTAPLVRNRQIMAYADQALAFWDGVSRGTVHAIRCAKELGKPVRVFRKI